MTTPKQWLRAWLGIATLEADVKARYLEVRAECHRETTAIAAELIRMKPTSTTFTVGRVLEETADPHLGRW